MTVTSVRIEAQPTSLRVAGLHLRRSGDERLADIGRQIREALQPAGPPMPWCVWCEAVDGRRRRAAFFDIGVPVCLEHDPHRPDPVRSGASAEGST
jgi:hypothetical protein